MKIARVFPRKTNATPDDDLVFFDGPPLLTLPEVDEVHVSVAFTYDREKAESLAYQWEQIGVPIKVGGPAYNDPGGVFVPGMYIKKRICHDFARLQQFVPVLLGTKARGMHQRTSDQ
jgi:hypothetical protein